MTALDIKIKGLPPRMIGPECPVVTVGRSNSNDLVVEHPSMSRFHAKFTWRDGGLMLEDLGSRNGSFVNGSALAQAQKVRAGDRIQLGHVDILLAERRASKVVIESGGSAVLPSSTLVMSAAMLRSGKVFEPGSERWTRILAFVQEMTLGLIRDVSPQQLLAELLDKLFEFLVAEHGVVLLRNGDGALEPAVFRSRKAQGEGAAIKLSQTLVEAATVRREAILLRDPTDTPDLASQSLIFSGVTTAIVTPMETEGQVIGLLYFDALYNRKPFDEDDLRLVTTLAHVAAAKIQNAKLVEEVEKKRALEQEMALARAIQLRLVPQPSCEGPSFQLAAELRPAKEVGGDLYDYFGDDRRLYFCIGDVSGKGVGAALVMALTKTLFRANAAFLQDPAEIMAAVNLRLYEETDPRIFVTAFCGVLDFASGRLAYANAGHDRPLRLVPGAAIATLEMKPGLALGALRGYPYTTQEAFLRPGDSLLLYTDGVTEAMDRSKSMFTLARAVACLEGHTAEAPEAVVRTVLQAVDAFSRGEPQADDITLLCLRYVGRP